MEQRQRVWSRLFPLAIFTVIGFVIVFYFFVDPVSSRFVPKCPFYLITGYECPGCGSQRMLHALLHADFAEAWRANAFLILLIPWLFMMTVAEVYHKRFPGLYRIMNHPVSIVLVSVAITVWFILRNFCGI